ncbi:hypothetical protein AGMMS49975_08840 [Clostridia bacterium]|nr:hypothetical protein AGMMS49975_08840 [Clostridia bacterium]
MAATYQKTNWVDEAVQYPDRYTKQDLTGGMVNLTPSPGIVDTVGTPQSAVNFNHLEAGVLDANIAISLLMLHIGQEDDILAATIQQITPEVNTLTFTNTKTFPFNNSLLTIPLTTPRKTLNYAVTILSAVASDNNPIGDITVSNKQLNGFAMAYSGSAASVTITYLVTGGITV